MSDPESVRTQLFQQLKESLSEITGTILWSTRGQSLLRVDMFYCHPIKEEDTQP